MRLATVIMLTALLVAAYTNNFTATVTCQICRKPCQSDRCLRITSQGFDQQYCPYQQYQNMNKSCKSSIKKQMIVKSCNYDLLGKVCPSKVCVTSKIKEDLCAYRIFNLTNCTNKNMNFNYNCSDCYNSSEKCFLLNSLKGFQYFPLGQTCNGVPSFQVRNAYSTCTQDRFGFNCTCCSTQVNMNQEAQQCVDDHKFLNKLPFFKSYSVSRLNQFLYSRALHFMNVVFLAIILAIK